MSTRAPMTSWSMRARSLLSLRIGSPSGPPDATRAAGEPVNLGLGSRSPEPDPESWVWAPLPHGFTGTDRATCTARVSDGLGFTGTCGEKYSSTVHTDPGDPVLAEEAARTPGSAVPGDHVSARMLEDYLTAYAKLERLEAQRIAHNVCLEYDLFPKGLLIIHKGLDAGAPPPKKVWGT